MEIENIIKEAVETLQQLPSFSGVPVFAENKGDIDEELKLRLAQQTVCVMVGWNGFTPQIQGATAPNGDLIGTAAIVVSVFERPAVNRATPGAATVFDLAKEIAKELHGASADGMDTPLALKRITPISVLGSSADGSVVTCDVEFETKTSL